MKTFLKYVLLFWTVVLIVMVLMIGFIRSCNSSNSYVMAWDDKMHMLDAPNRKPSIVLVGGSNVALGFQSQMIVDSIGMPVINAGQHAGMGLKFILDECLPRLHRGDVLVLSPETASHFYAENYYGGDEYVYMFCLGMVPHNEISGKQVRRIIEQLPSCLMRRVLTANIFSKSEGGVYHRDGFNQYGDMVWHWTNDSLKHFDAVAPEQDDKAPFNEDALKNVVRRLNDAQKRGIKVVMFSPAADKMFFKNKYYRFSTVAKRLGDDGFQFPDSTGVDLMDNDCTYDTHYHLNRKGSALHTQHLIAWLKILGIGQTR
jgi:hypothetical protein